MSLMKYATVALLVGLFTIALINFSVNLTESNDVNGSLMTDPNLNSSFTDIQTELEASKSVAEGIRSSFFGQIPIIGDIAVILGYIFGTTKQIFALIRGLFELYFELIQTYMGIPPIVTTVFTTIIVLTLILLAWRVYRAGS